MTWDREPRAPDGVTDPLRRRVVITLSGAAAACDRACLIRIAEQYITAFAKQDPSSLPLAQNVRFTENGTPLPIGNGLWPVPTMEK